MVEGYMNFEYLEDRRIPLRCGALRRNFDVNPKLARAPEHLAGDISASLCGEAYRPILPVDGGQRGSRKCNIK